MITLLNSSILTNFGCYEYREITTEEVKKMLSEENWISAIGHISTAKFISKLLGIKCKVNRMLYIQNVNEKAIVFKVHGRLDERKFYTEKDLEEKEYSWGLLIRRY